MNQRFGEAPATERCAITRHWTSSNMQWSDEAVILHAKPHAETAAIVETFTRQHGRSLGLVHGGRSRKLRPVLQIGNFVDVTWKGRLAEHLGSMSVELRKSHAASAMESSLTLAGLTSMCALLRLLAEREPHPNLFEVLLFVLGFLDEPDVWPALVVRWELALLDELGFGLDLGTCAASGANDHLVYVSPRTGRAVSASAGEPYHDRLLSLPAFLTKGWRGQVMTDDVLAGFRLTGHFLDVNVFDPRGLKSPEARHRLTTLLHRRIGA